MRNPNQTASLNNLSRPAVQSPPGNQRRISLAPLTAAILMGMALLSGCGPAPSNQTSVTQPATPTVTEAVEGATDMADTAETDQIDSTAVNTTGDTISVDSITATRDDQPAVEPDFGEITFALDATDDFQPIDPGFLFTAGITQIHAIFEYQAMSPAYTWERVWYLNDREVARSSGAWTEPESGVFDYYIDNGGKPLPAGDYLLELYVEGKLRSLGVFIIEAE